MTNRQWLLNKMQNMSDEEFGKLFNGTTVICDLQEPNCPCESNDTTCTECKANWLQQEHKEKPKLSDAERVILEVINEKYGWIARDEDNTISVFTDEPSKMINGSGFWGRVEDDFNNLECFNHLFQFIKWEDTEPYNIEELLKGK